MPKINLSKLTPEEKKALKDKLEALVAEKKKEQREKEYEEAPIMEMKGVNEIVKAIKELDAKIEVNVPKQEPIKINQELNLSQEAFSMLASLKGEPGQPGRDGKTPVRGIDYLTFEDKREMAVDAINVLENFEGDDRLDAKAIKNIEDNIDIDKLNIPKFNFDDYKNDFVSLLPKLPPQNAGGSGATFLKSMRDFDVPREENRTDGYAVTWNASKNKFDLQQGGGGSSTLQEVTDNGAVTTNSITIQNATGITYGDGTDQNMDLITIDRASTDAKLEWDDSIGGFKFNGGSTGVVIGSDGDLTHTIGGTSVTSQLEIHSEGSGNLGGIAIHRHSNTDNFGGHQLFLRSDGTHASPAIVTDNQILGRMMGLGYDGTDYEQAAEIRFLTDGTPANNNMPGEIAFYTNAGSQTLTKRMSIRADGSLDLDAYGSGTFTGTATKYLAVDSSGNLIEEDAPFNTAGTGLGSSGSTVNLDIPSLSDTGEALVDTDTLAIYNASTAAHEEATLAQLLTYVENNGSFSSTLAGVSSASTNTAESTYTLNGSNPVIFTDGGSSPSFDAGTVAVFQQNSDTADNAFISIIGGLTGDAGINFGTANDENAGQIVYETNTNPDRWSLYVEGGTINVRHSNTQHTFYKSGGVAVQIYDYFTSTVMSGASGAAPWMWMNTSYNVTRPQYASFQDTDTGLAFPSAGVAQITVGGQEKLKVNSSGYLSVNANGFTQLYQTQITTTDDAIVDTDTLDVSGTTLLIHRNDNTNNAGCAIGFAGGTANTNIGAMIAFERTSTNSKGRLRFGVKTDTGSASDIDDNMAINDDGKVHFFDDSIVVSTSKTPSSASDTGTQGEVAWDSNYIYICTATDTWKRVAIATW
jgi:hypothetical protein